MKLRLILLALIFPLFVIAQPPANDEYEVITPEDKLLDSYGKKYPGYYVTKEGKKTDCLILFETGDKMNAFGSKLNTSLSHQGESEFIDKNNLSAFFVNDRLYAPAVVYDTLKWVHLQTQGAIRSVGVASHSEMNVNRKIEFWYNKETGANVGYWDTLGVIMPHWVEVNFHQKLDGDAKNIIMFSRKKMVEWVKEDTDLASKIENKEKGYKDGLMFENYKGTMFGYYNKWYDETNPGGITYYEARATFVAPDKPIVVAAAATAVVAETARGYEEEVKEATESAHRAPRIDAFAGRPATASAAVSSAKPEVAVKKQSFKDRLARIKTDGNSVGVLVTSKNLVINPGSGTSEGIKKAQVMGSYGPLKGIDKIAKTTAAELNKGFGTDVFEAVDYSQIPVKEGKYGKMDDWWSTKYKMIFIYELEPSYSAIYKVVNSETLEREYQAKMHVHGDIIVMSAEEIKPEKLKYVTSSPKTWGYYNSEKFIGPAETDFHTIQQLKVAINPPSDDVVVDAIIKSQKSGLDKFVKKKSK
jgi:hypothetical protein